MRRVMLRSLWAHKRRLLSTLLAILLGVGFMSGTLILASTIQERSDARQASALGNVDLVAEATPPASTSLGRRAPLTSSLVDRVREVHGVAAAEGFLSLAAVGGTNRVLAAAGYPMGGQLGPSTTLESWVGDERLTAFRLEDGRAPAGPDEVALNEQAAQRGGLTIGAPVTVLGQFGPEPYTLVGTFRSGAGGQIDRAITAAFTPSAAERLAGRTGFDSVRIAVTAGEEVEAVRARLAAELPDVVVRTGEEAAAEIHGTSGDLGFLRLVLVVFGVVALLVGTFVITNTFTILVAQRTKELALLRALGASRAQVFGSVLAEATLIGFLGAGLGLLVGVQTAVLINRGLAQVGARLPADTLSVGSSTLLLALAVGVGATVAAAVVPAARAASVPPLAAIRDMEVDQVPESRRRLFVALLLVAIGAGTMVMAWRADGDPRGIPTAGAGAVLLIGGVLAGGPFVAGPAARRARRPLRRFGGIRGQLASDNAARNPRRTSATGGAVVISVALVVFVSAFAASALRSISSDARRGFRGDFVVTGPGGLTLPNGMLASPIPATVRDAIAAVDGIAQVAGMGYDVGRVRFPDGSVATESVTSVDQDGLGPILRPAMAVGRGEDLRDDGILVDRVVAARHSLEIGDRLRYSTGGGRALELVVAGISDDPNILGYFTVTRRAYASVAPMDRDVQVGGLFEPGVDEEAVLAGIRAAIADVPTVGVLGRDAFVADLESQVSGFISLVYGLLVLSVLISILGVSNTLSLTIHERTRELGLLRSLGMDRPSVRSMIRWEALLVSIWGATAGLVVGLVVSVGVVHSLRDFGLVEFAVSPALLAAMAGGVAAVGVVASVQPARRAAAAPILLAIAADG